MIKIELLSNMKQTYFEEILVDIFYIKSNPSSDIASDLTPERFRKITADTIDQLKVNLKLQQAR